MYRPERAPIAGRCALQMRGLSASVQDGSAARRDREQHPGGVHESHRTTQPSDGLNSGNFGLSPVQRWGKDRVINALTIPVDHSAGVTQYMRTILVTGGAGYVGSHACKYLKQAGFLPVTFDDLSTGHESAVKWGPLERGSLQQAATIKKAIEKHRPEGVMHFAASAYVGESVANPEKYYSNNVVGSLNLLQAMIECGIGKIVFSGSCTVYGEVANDRISEDTDVRPMNPYGQTKAIVEQMMADFRGAHSLKFVSLRYFNASGADPDGEIGEDHAPETHLIPLAIRTALGEEQRLQIFGSDYPTPDGTCVRDYIHVVDLADAHVRAISHLFEGDLPTCINLGAGRGASVHEVIDSVRRICGRDVPTELAGRRPGDPPCLIADITRAGKTLGWRPAHSDLDNIVRTAYSWHRNQASPSL